MKKLSTLFEKAVFRLAKAVAPVDKTTPAPRELGSLNLGANDYAESPQEKGFLDLWREDQHKATPPI